MKTTLNGVVFLLPHVSSHAKTEFHRRRIFPGPREEGGNGMRRPGESCRTRTVGRQNEAAERGSKMDSRTERQDEAAGRGGRTRRQNGAVRWTAGQSGRTGRRTRRQNRAAGQGGRTGRRTRRQNRAAGRGGRTGRQDGAAGRSGRTERQKKRGGEAASSQRTDPGRRPHKQKTGETIGPARFSTGIPTAESRRTAKKRTEKRPGICKRPTHRFSIRCSDTGKGAILSARPPLVK